MEILPNLHLVPDVIANPYLIVDPDGLTLIDTGLPGSHKKILRYMADRGFKPADLRRIIITHADFDHVGSLAALKAATGAEVYASRIEADAIEAGRQSRRIRPTHLGRRLLMSVAGRLFRAKTVRVDKILEDGASLPIFGGLTVLFTPGHTPGHISLFAPSAGVLFTGDSIVSRESGLVGSVPANTWNQEAATSSVRKQAVLGARIVCPGHGSFVFDAAGKMPAV